MGYLHRKHAAQFSRSVEKQDKHLSALLALNERKHKFAEDVKQRSEDAALEEPAYSKMKRQEYRQGRTLQKQLDQKLGRAKSNRDEIRLGSRYTFRERAVGRDALNFDPK